MTLCNDRKVVEHSFTYHGTDYPGYFQGAGIAFTEWDSCYTGIGDTPHEAAQDAIEQAACSGWDCELLEDDLPDESEPLNEDESHYVTLYLK